MRKLVKKIKARKHAQTIVEFAIATALIGIVGGIAMTKVTPAMLRNAVTSSVSTNSGVSSSGQVTVLPYGEKSSAYSSSTTTISSTVPTPGTYSSSTVTAESAPVTVPPPTTAAPTVVPTSAPTVAPTVPPTTSAPTQAPTQVSSTNVYIVGSYQPYCAGLTLQDNIDDFSGVDVGFTGVDTHNGRYADGSIGPNGCFSNYDTHKYIDLTDGGDWTDADNQAWQTLLGKMSSNTKKLTYTAAEAYIIDANGNVLGTVALDQLGTSIGYQNSFFSFTPNPAENPNFSVLQNLGVNSSTGWYDHEKGDGGQIELNGTIYNIASTICRKWSPLTFDLNGDGIKTLAKLIKFDLIGNGKPVLVNDTSDGILCIKGGKSGKDLFGNVTDLGDGQKFANGFEALKALALKEGLSHNVLTSADFKILEKKYGFGMKVGGYNGKVVSLESLGITQINLGSTEKVTEKQNFDGRSNTLMEEAGATFTINGKIREYADIWDSLK